MNRLFAASALALLPQLAHASTEFYPLYDQERTLAPPKAREAVAKAVSGCGYSMFSRLGPRPAEMARCNAAISEVVQQGPAGARAALAAIDDVKTNSGARWRLYDAVARAADLTMVDGLIRALEREEAAGLGNARQPERHQLVTTLSRLTYAEPKGTPAVQWRAWWGAHQGMTRAELFEERMKEVEAQLQSDDPGERNAAQSFLAAHKDMPRAKVLLARLAPQPAPQPQRPPMIVPAQGARQAAIPRS